MLYNIPISIPDNLSITDKITLITLLEAKAYVESRRKFFRTFPDDNRSGYSKHISFFNDGSTYRQRAFLAGNRTGKTYSGAYEMTCHLTGIYPDWWTGKRFDVPIKAWVVGKSSDTVRDTTQAELLGGPGHIGEGMIPGNLLGRVTSTAQRADIVTVLHVSGEYSTLGFKSDSAGRSSFEGTAMDVIWMDEEISIEVYLECLMRTTTTGGIIFTTFTPLKGLTDLVLSLIEDGNLDTPKAGISITTCSWDDVPHLSSEVKAEMLAALPPHQRLARSAGIPQLGSGVIYPIDPTSYIISPFEIPKHWLRLNSLDVGWRKTACTFMAINPDDGTIYVYSEHYVGEAEPIIHATAIKSRGDNLPTVIDSAAHGRSQHDGQNLFSMYKDIGLNLFNANKAVETGIYMVWELFSAGKLKIFANCTNLLSELKTYRRDESGKIIKSNDHLCDCLRYGIMTREHAKSTIPKVVDHSSYNVVSTQYRRSI